MNINYDFLLPVGVAHLQPGASPPTLNGWQTTAEAGTGVVFAGQGPIGRSNPPWDGFLTRLCYECELLVSSEIMHRSPTPPGPLFGGGVGTIPALKVGTKQEEREWLWYPEVSCTCKWRLGITPLPDRQTLCYEHTKKELEKLVKTKNRNDEWLRNIERVPGKAGLRDATVATKRARVISGSWRACRCGKEINHAAGHIPNIFQCMACEGYCTTIGAATHHAYTPPGGAPPPPVGLPVPLPVLRQIKQYKFKLGRHYSGRSWTTAFP